MVGLGIRLDGQNVSGDAEKERAKGIEDCVGDLRIFDSPISTLEAVIKNF